MSKCKRCGPGMSCMACCPCQRCQEARSCTLDPEAKAAMEEVGQGELAEVLAEAMGVFQNLTEHDLGHMKERLGFTPDDIAPMDTLTADQMRVFIHLMGAVVHTSSVFNDAGVLLQSLEGSPLAAGVANSALGQNDMHQGIMLLCRDLIVAVCRIGLLNPGLITPDMCGESGLVSNMQIAGNLLAHNLGMAEDMAEDMGAVIESALGEIATTVKAPRGNPFGGSRSPAEA